ncbi:PH, RCC1 and FYVE domains-containing protein 1-like isoform X2 [Pyrus x bretschneideri]|uniref:PH, RCC1 and FYVE domains-containing protein 1-like isoform X2 n=1 Tax=Pyrus x bretschneideri TaxID=225117 RepID=UPI0020302886|nr:PH, RCC1 and FYVE domains-containing protein 1-like isoform X2 [Pyrus x bretschneideri]
MVVRESLSFVHLDFLLLSFNDIYVLKRTIYHFLFHAITESGLLIWKVEAQVWIAGLKALISSGRGGRSKIDGWSDGGLYLDVLQDGKHLTSNSRSDSSASGARDSGSPDYEFKLKVFS